MLLELEQTTHIGAAEVLEVAAPLVRLQIIRGQVWAQVALAYPYQARVGDVVLTIGQREAWYVIGVIRGTGPTVFAVPGDLRIQAPCGSIELMARRGIRLRGSTVKIAADKLEIAARALFERFTNVTQWIHETFQLRAGRVNSQIDNDYRVQAGRILERAAGDVKIDGKKISLG